MNQPVDPKIAEASAEAAKAEPAKAAASDAPLFERERKFHLYKPITVAGRNGPLTIDELTFDTPTGDEMFEIGMPYEQGITETFGLDGKVTSRRWVAEFKGGILRQWMERLCQNKNVSRSDFGKLSGRDVRTIYEWICRETNELPNFATSSKL